MSHISPALTHYFKQQQNESDAKKLHKLQQSVLCNEQTFYRAFLKDLLAAKREVIIYCPFVSKYRSEFFKKALKELQRRNIAVFIFTRPVEEHERMLKAEVTCALRDYEECGASLTYLPGYIHEKVAIIDREILWEGSLNILSQRKSREMMRRLPDAVLAKQTMMYLGLNLWIAAGYKSQYERLYRSLADGVNERRARARIVGIGIGVAVLILWLLPLLHGTIGVLKEIAGVIQLLNTPIR